MPQNPYCEQHSLLSGQIVLPTSPPPHDPKMLGAAPPVDGGGKPPLPLPGAAGAGTAGALQYSAEVPQWPCWEQHSAGSGHRPSPLLPPPHVASQWAGVVPQNPYVEQHSAGLAHSPSPLLPSPQVPPPREVLLSTPGFPHGCCCCCCCGRTMGGVGGGAASSMHGVFAKQVSPAPHCVGAPVGHAREHPTASPQDEPQKFPFACTTREVVVMEAATAAATAKSFIDVMGNLLV